MRAFELKLTNHPLIELWEEADKNMKATFAGLVSDVEMCLEFGEQFTRYS